MLEYFEVSFYIRDVKKVWRNGELADVHDNSASSIRPDTFLLETMKRKEMVIHGPFPNWWGGDRL